MPGIGPNIIRTCVVCGEKFHPKSTRQQSCNKPIELTCPICGKKYPGICTVARQKATCSPECQVKLIKQKREASAKLSKKICKWCGKEFIPKTVRDEYCQDTHYQTCAVCGKQFVIDPAKDSTVKTCSKECRYKLAKANTDMESMTETLKQTMLAKYGVDNIMHVDGIADRIKQTNRERYGSDWYTQTAEYAQKVAQTDMQKYGVEHHLKSPEVIAKREQTNIDKYGVPNVAQSSSVKATIKQSMIAKYGADSPIKVPEIRRKITANSRTSNLEKRICALLDNYSIEYIHHYIIKKDDLSHEYDFYLPKYNLLIDADGLYYHGYLDDPDGEKVRDDYDAVRLALVPDDCAFHVIVENQEDRQVKQLVELIEAIDHDAYSYDNALFKWCRSIDFPYPNYTTDRMLKDWKHLQEYSNDKYVPQCRIGMSIVKHFHPSMYHSHVGRNMSPYEGWHDDGVLRDIIKNRLIYKNDVDPSKVLAGFSIARRCPCVSVFNPILGKYLTTKYLNEFNIVFDPFSGFSGRMLGVVASGKRYIGMDINDQHVTDTNRIARFLQIEDRICVAEQDVLTSNGEFECLLTCPPYGTKEIYGRETVFKSCDEWIDECLARFYCKRYAFVVDKTNKYSEYVKEEIKSPSHLNVASEYVVIIDR